MTKSINDKVSEKPTTASKKASSKSSQSKPAAKSSSKTKSAITKSSSKADSRTEKTASPTRNAKGQFVKGSPKPATSGRKPGTKNKYGNVRDRLKSIILPYLNTDPDAPDKTLGKDLMKLEPGSRVEAVAKYLPFLVPKYSSTTITADANRPIAEEDRLNELDKEYTKKETEITIKSLTIVDNDNDGKQLNLTKDQLKDLGL